MKLLWQIRAVKTFLYAVLVAYAGAVIYPWIQIGLGYSPPHDPATSWWPTPVEYATVMSVSLLVYVGVFAVPLIVASLYTVRSLRKKYMAWQKSESKET